MAKKYRYKESRRYLEADAQRCKNFTDLIDYLVDHVKGLDKQGLGHLVFYYYTCETIKLLTYNPPIHIIRNFSEQLRKAIDKKTGYIYYLKFEVYDYYNTEDEIEFIKDLRHGVEFAADCTFSGNVARQKVFYDYLKLTYELDKELHKRSW